MAEEHPVGGEAFDPPVVAGLSRALDPNRSDDDARTGVASFVHRALKSEELHPVELNLFKAKRECSFELLLVAAEGNEER